MHVQLLEAFKVLDSGATMESILEACSQLFVESDEYNMSLEHRFDSSEVEAVANAIYEYIANPAVALREIAFKVSRPLEGEAIEYGEYASMFSGDMLNQNLSREFASLNLDDLRSALKTFLVGILFRYRFCVFEDRAAFPSSMILRYMDSVRVLLSREQREGELSDVLWTTLRALASLDDAPQIL
jgi:predicted HicB family RNase H-like nuclease